MKNAEAVVAVKFNSTHSAEKLMSICNEDLDIFRAVPGLVQKYYITEEGTGALSGIYIFENKAARTVFLVSDVAKGIPARYGANPENLRVELYDMSIVMNEVVTA